MDEPMPPAEALREAAFGMLESVLAEHSAVGNLVALFKRCVDEAKAHEAAAALDVKARAAAQAKARQQEEKAHAKVEEEERKRLAAAAAAAEAEAKKRAKAAKRLERTSAEKSAPAVSPETAMAAQASSSRQLMSACSNETKGNEAAVVVYYEPVEPGSSPKMKTPSSPAALVSSSRLERSRARVQVHERTATAAEPPASTVKPPSHRPAASFMGLSLEEEEEEEAAAKRRANHALVVRWGGWLIDECKEFEQLSPLQRTGLEELGKRWLEKLEQGSDADGKARSLAVDTLTKWLTSELKQLVGANRLREALARREDEG